MRHPIIRLTILSVVATALLVFEHSSASASITSETVCRVQGALRGPLPLWPEALCARAARALNLAAYTTGVPAEVFLAIMVLESDMRLDAAHWYGPTLADLGPMGIRCYVDEGVCTNGHAAGMTTERVMSLETNVALAGKILASKRRLRDYNGGPRYGEQALAVASAINGVTFGEGARKRLGERVRDLVDRILRTFRRNP